MIRLTIFFMLEVLCMKKEKCCCCNSDNSQEAIIGEYVCYCNHVTEEDIVNAIKMGAENVEAVIKKTGAMKNSNCAVNNPKGTCCYSDIVHVFNKYKLE
ncbi:(2Fe-2S)-binding protein [Clostridium botulinum]|nr:(2Fe-2S)-binding protein [Clostridium botulinum]NFR21963.1 (2Fe-2S)-binding protein [Clostridium botulinum]